MRRDIIVVDVDRHLFKTKLHGPISTNGVTLCFKGTHEIIQCFHTLRKGRWPKVGVQVDGPPWNVGFPSSPSDAVVIRGPVALAVALDIKTFPQSILKRARDP